MADASFHSDYKIACTLAVSEVGRLVVTDPYEAEGGQLSDTAGREVFLLDMMDQPVWQITPEESSSEGRLHEFDRAITTMEPFVNVWSARNGYYASRMNGDTFLIDMVSGAATFSGWVRI